MSKRRLIINILDDTSDKDAMHYVDKVIWGGLKSKTSKGEQYCFATTFRDGTVVYADKTKLGHSFRIFNVNKEG